MSASKLPLIIGYLYEPYGSHPSGWRSPQSAHDPYDVDDLVAVARLAEDAKLDFFAVEDRLVADMSDPASPSRATRTEPFTTASFLATKTSRIGLLVTANTSYYEPYNLARLSASLDHVTHGRAGWTVSTGATQPADQNYSQSPLPAERHYARADEAVDVIRKLWDSWEDDAFIRNKATGEFVDGEKIHPVDHEGEHFRIRGPLNVARPPQSQLIVGHAVESGEGEAFAAREADVVFVTPGSIEEGQTLRQQLREKASAEGRDPDSIRVIVEITPVAAATDAEANHLVAGLDALGGHAPGLVVVGSAETIAAVFAAWAEAGAADGFLIRSAVLPAQLRAFAEFVLPELRNRGLARSDYDAPTLRGNLGASPIPNRLVA